MNETNKMEHSLQSQNNKDRWSGIELLKIFAIFSIVTCHAVSTLQHGSVYVDTAKSVLSIDMATTDPQLFLLSLMKYSGALGNSIFFICSAWFLLDKSGGGRAPEEDPANYDGCVDHFYHFSYCCLPSQAREC